MAGKNQRIKKKKNKKMGWMERRKEGGKEDKKGDTGKVVVGGAA
jgi:hypothetical protein